MQSIPFKVNTVMLDFIEENVEQLYASGLLEPPFLASVKPSLVRKELKKVLSTGEYKGKFKYSTIWHILDRRIQRARYEQFLLSLAGAYDGYRIDFPAFMDFRGRVYRAGV